MENSRGEHASNCCLAASSEWQQAGSFDVTAHTTYAAALCQIGTLPKLDILT